MVWSATSRIAWNVAFPADRPSPLLAFCGVLTNTLLIIATSEAWRQDGGCVSQNAASRVWLVVGAANQAAHAGFAVGITLVIRRRAQGLSGTSCSLEGISLASVILHHGIVFVYVVFFVWIVVWVSVAFARSPLSSCTASDVCCRFLNAYSSFNVFYAALVVFLFAFTLLTERGREPRWWQTALLSDLRRRELRMLYEEQLGRTSRTARANSNADTDREMLLAKQAPRGAGALVANTRDDMVSRSQKPPEELRPAATSAAPLDDVEHPDSPSAQSYREPAVSAVRRLTSGLQRRPLPEDFQKSILMTTTDVPAHPSARAARRSSRMVRFAAEHEDAVFRSESHQDAFYDAPQRVRRPHPSFVAQLVDRASVRAPKPRRAVVVAQPSIVAARGGHDSVIEQVTASAVELDDVNLNVLHRE